MSKKSDIQKGLEAMLGFAAGEPHCSATLAAAIRSLSEAVVRTYFAKFSDQEELISIGMAKSLELLRNPKFDPSLNPRSFLYTGIRNEVGNHLRRSSRSFPITPESDDFGVRGPSDRDVILSVEYERERQLILDRLQRCGVVDGRYRDTVRGAALYRAIL